jgi:WXG100 family type VII secretion target
MATNVGSGSGSSSGGGGSDKIRLNYAQMQDMATQCTKVAQRLLQTVTLVQQVAAQMQGGALVGDAGDAFTSALTSSLVPAIQRISDKFAEINGDILGAISDMQAQDSQAGNRFN